MFPLNPIIAAAAVNVLIGLGIHHCCGHMIAKTLGKKAIKLKDMPLRLAIEIVSSLMTASALYVAILVFQKSELTFKEDIFTRVYSWFVTGVKMETSMMASLKIAGFFWLGFMVPHILCHLASDEQMNGKKSLLKATLSLVHFLAMGAAIAYFA